MFYCDLCQKWHRRASALKRTLQGTTVLTCLRQWRKHCPHERTIRTTLGRYHYTAGEVWDDLREEVYCLDCGKSLRALGAYGHTPLLKSTALPG